MLQICLKCCLVYLIIITIILYNIIIYTIYVYFFIYILSEYIQMQNLDNLDKLYNFII
jgi:hypothetical protein